MSGSPDREIMTLEEAAELLGVSVKTFNKVLHSESIPARKVGREWKFSRRALIEWIGSGRSDEFYREHEPEHEHEHEPENGSRPLPGGVDASRRRTSGWRLEYD